MDRVKQNGLGEILGIGQQERQGRKDTFVLQDKIENFYFLLQKWRGDDQGKQKGIFGIGDDIQNILVEANFSRV